MQIISYSNKKSLKIRSEILKKIRKIRHKLKSILIVIGEMVYVFKLSKNIKIQKNSFMVSTQEITDF